VWKRGAYEQFNAKADSLGMDNLLVHSVLAYWFGSVDKETEDRQAGYS